MNTVGTQICCVSPQWFLYMEHLGFLGLSINKPPKAILTFRNYEVMPFRMRSCGLRINVPNSFYSGYQIVHFFSPHPLSLSRFVQKWDYADNISRRKKQKGITSWLEFDIDCFLLQFVRIYEANHGVHISFFDPVNNTETPPPSLFSWKEYEWSECSRNCGGGKITQEHTSIINTVMGCKHCR